MTEATLDAPPFPAISFVLRHATAILRGGAAASALVVLWLALRTGWLELVVAAPFAALAVHFVLRVALEVVSLVAETLMPR